MDVSCAHFHRQQYSGPQVYACWKSLHVHSQSATMIKRNQITPLKDIHWLFILPEIISHLFVQQLQNSSKPSDKSNSADDKQWMRFIFLKLFFFFTPASSCSMRFDAALWNMNLIKT